MILPDKIYFTGAPGSTWSGIAFHIESLGGFNISDRTPERSHAHSQIGKHIGGHYGAYFVKDTELEPDAFNVDYAWTEDGGCKLVKSHEWAKQLITIKNICEKTGDWIILVYRPELACYSWWFETGGFNITYPKYHHYDNHNKMLYAIQEQNRLILEFAHENMLEWKYFNCEWCKLHFGVGYAPRKKRLDTLISIYKP